MTDENCETCGGMEDEHRWFEDEREAARYGGAHPFAPPLTADVQEVPDLETARLNITTCEMCKGRGGFSDTTLGRGGYGGQQLTGCPRCKGVGFDLTEFEEAVRADERRKQ